MDNIPAWKNIFTPQYTFFPGTTPLTPPLEFSTSPAYRGIKCT